MDALLEHGFTHQALLEEIMHALSTYEADSLFDHIERMHGIGVDEDDEDEDEDDEDEDTDVDEEDAEDEYVDAPDGHAWDKDGNLVKTVLPFIPKT
jgi:hypothetical protein